MICTSFFFTLYKFPTQLSAIIDTKDKRVCVVFMRNAALLKLSFAKHTQHTNWNVDFANTDHSTVNTGLTSNAYNIIYSEYIHKCSILR